MHSIPSGLRRRAALIAWIFLTACASGPATPVPIFSPAPNAVEPSPAPPLTSTPTLTTTPESASSPIPMIGTSSPLAQGGGAAVTPATGDQVRVRQESITLLAYPYELFQQDALDR